MPIHFAQAMPAAKNYLGKVRRGVDLDHFDVR
jgi:hypothetical protein